MTSEHQYPTFFLSVRIVADTPTRSAISSARVHLNAKCHIGFIIIPLLCVKLFCEECTIFGGERHSSSWTCAEVVEGHAEAFVRWPVRFLTVLGAVSTGCLCIVCRTRWQVSRTLGSGRSTCCAVSRRCERELKTESWTNCEEIAKKNISLVGATQVSGMKTR